jgi:DNA-binding transcriptional LysR family regulator
MPNIPRITLRRLQVFLAIADSGSFRAAAEKLGIAQPSVSTHVQALEDQTGGALFQRRRGRRVELTDLGQTFLTHSRQLLAEADSMASGLHRWRLQAERRVVFACQRSLSDLMAPLLAEFAAQYREIELMTRVGRHEEVVEWIKDGSADVGLYLSNNEFPGLTSIVVGQQEIAVVASPCHPLAHRAKVTPSELEVCNFVGPPEGSLLGQGIAQLLADIGVKVVKTVSKATEFEFLRALVIGEVGLYCCLRTRVQADLDNGRLVMLSLDAPPLMMDMRQSLSIKRPLSPSVALVGEFLRGPFNARLLTQAKRSGRTEGASSLSISK